MPQVAGADTGNFRKLEPVNRTQRASESDCRRTVDEAVSRPSRISVSDGNAVTKELKIWGGIDLAPRTLSRFSPAKAPGDSSTRRSRAEQFQRWTAVYPRLRSTQNRRSEGECGVHQAGKRVDENNADAASRWLPAPWICGPWQYHLHPHSRPLLQDAHGVGHDPNFLKYGQH